MASHAHPPRRGRLGLHKKTFATKDQRPSGTLVTCGYATPPLSWVFNLNTGEGMSSNKWLYLAAAALLSLSTNIALAQGQGHGYGHDKDKHDRDEDRRGDDRRGNDRRNDKRQAKEDRHYYREHDRELHGWYEGHRDHL